MAVTQKLQAGQASVSLGMRGLRFAPIPSSWVKYHREAAFICGHFTGRYGRAFLRPLAKRQYPSHLLLRGLHLDGVEERTKTRLGGEMSRFTEAKTCHVPWRFKCGRIVEHVHSVFSVKSENWSWTPKTLDGIKGWETEAISRLSRFKSVEGGAVDMTCLNEMA